MEKKTPKKKLKIGLKVRTNIKAGPTRRAELDHLGAYNFTVEIEGVSVG